MTKASDGSSSSDGSKSVDSRVSYDEYLQLQNKGVTKDAPKENFEKPGQPSSRWSFDDALLGKAGGKDQTSTIQQSKQMPKDGDLVKESVESRATFGQSVFSHEKPPEVTQKTEKKVIPEVKVPPAKLKTPEMKPTPQKIKTLPESLTRGAIEGDKKDSKKSPPSMPQQPPSPFMSSQLAGQQSSLQRPTPLPPKSEPPKPDTTVPRAKENVPQMPSASDIKSKLKSFLDKLGQSSKEAFSSISLQMKQASLGGPSKGSNEKPLHIKFPTAMSDKGGAASTAGRPMKFPYTLSAQIAQFPMKYYVNNTWLVKYYLIAIGVCAPLFYKIGKLSNSPENKRVWDEKRRQLFTPGGHH